MTYKKFTQILEERFGKLPISAPKKIPWGQWNFHEQRFAAGPFAMMEDGTIVLFHQYSTGGVSGGSYIYSDPQPYTSIPTISETNFISLDSILEFFKPDISYLAYKKITRSIKELDYEIGQCYGNQIDMHVLYIDIKELYEFLK